MPRKTTQIGLEPTTFAVTGRRSNQLSHWAIFFIMKVYTFKTAHGNVTQNHPTVPLSFPACAALPHSWLSPRPISIGQLHALLRFHPQPIYLVFSKGSSRFRVGRLILRGASRLDAFSAYPFRTWLPGRAIGMTTGAPVVRPARSSRTEASPSQTSCARAG